MIVLFFSNVDKFSKNVFTSIKDKLNSIEDSLTYSIYTYGDTYVVYLKDIDLPLVDRETLEKIIQKIDTSRSLRIIFISRHEMKNPKPLLTVHTSGNWSKAEYGGYDYEISISNACLNSNILRMLNKLAQENSLLDKYSISMEATHHGPSIDYESCFIEVGSTIEEWSDIRCIKIFQYLIEDIVQNYEKYLKKVGKISISIGDLHYCTLTNHVLSGEYDIGHTIPKYIENIIEKNIVDSILKTRPDVECVIIHWKSLKKDVREFVINIVKSRFPNIEIIKRK